jgi:hypothetical protein
MLAELQPQWHDNHSRCPECNANWDGGDIFEILRTQDWCKDKSDEELRAYITQCYAPPHRFSRLIGVELAYDHPDHYDGVSYWECPDCHYQFPRFKKGSRRQ